MVNIYGRTNKHIEDRPLGFCEACNRRFKQRLNMFQYKDGITANICDKCTERITEGKYLI